jgi:GalNAc-alpha-(1->4)-GalNAc-alpha-(1->3)-diNAcBac-PP-undecaprenol alpha-1,4-N-acetyl-D-galactosaminyltransferase
VPNPIPVRLRQEGLSYGPSTHYKIVAAGTLETRKNFGLLIEAFSRIAPRHPEWSLEIWGRGPLRDELEALTSNLGLRGRVSLPGSTPELLVKMGEGHIFAMPSILESFGMVSLEAMSVGLPVVGLRRCLGTNEVVEHERTGLLVDGADLVGDFANALERLMSSPEERERFGRAGLEAAKKYDQRRVGDLWHELLLDPARQSTRPASSA